MRDIDPLQQLCATQHIPLTLGAPLAEFCTFRVGGPADALAEPATEEQLASLLAFASERGLPRLVLGKGSNVLFSDEGFRGLVIRLTDAFAGMELLDGNVIACRSGSSLTALCRFALDRSLTGLEFAYGIPGSVGGAVYMNAGAYGGEMKDVLTGAGHLAPDGTAGRFQGEGLALSYRRSAYTDTELVITRAFVGLAPGDPAAIKAAMEDFMARRRSKQPLELPSAGSTFKRPAQGYASALIDQCGLKGLSIGGAQVSEKHAGFVVNRGGATCRDILALIEAVRDRVASHTGIRLEPEVKVIPPNGVSL